MFRSILVPLDGSIRAEQALPVAAHIAHGSEGTIVLLRVVPSLSAYDRSRGGVFAEPGDAQPSAVEQDKIDAAFDEVRSYLEITARSKELEGIKLEIRVLYGSASTHILDTVHSMQCDLIVMCSHGYTGMKRWAMGSVADYVVRHSPIPVLVLREHAGVPTNLHPEGTRPVRILVALDGSSLAEEVVMPAAQLSAALSAPLPGVLHLAWIVPLSAIDASGAIASIIEVNEQAAAELKTCLNTVKRQLQENEASPPNLLITTSVNVGMDVAETLIRIAEVGNDEAGKEIEGVEEFQRCDVIALATHGRGGFKRWAIGSVAEDILRKSRLPFLIVRPPKTK